MSISDKVSAATRASGRILSAAAGRIVELAGRVKAGTPVTPDVEEFFKTPEGRAHLAEFFKTPEGAKALRRSLWDSIRRRQPSLREAVWADACIFSSMGMQPPAFKTRLGFVVEATRLAWESDAFFCMMLYRVRTRLFANKVPLLPTVLHRACMVLAQIDIGHGVTIQPGVYIPHGQVVIDGMIEIGSGTVITPWVTLGRSGEALEGPSIGQDVFIGTGAKVLGPLKIGAGARIGANSVVLKDIAPHTTVAGAPAKVVRVHAVAADSAGSADGGPNGSG